MALVTTTSNPFDRRLAMALSTSVLSVDESRLITHGPVWAVAGFSACGVGFATGVTAGFCLIAGTCCVSVLSGLSWFVVAGTAFGVVWTGVVATGAIAWV